jgi:hypothetical protein
VRNVDLRFRNAEWEDLRQDDVLTLLSWLFFGQTLAATQQDAKSGQLLSKMYRTFEARSGSNFPLGRNSSVQVTCLSLDPIIAVPRPLLICAF